MKATEKEKAKMREYHKRTYKQRREKILKTSVAWKKNNPERVKELKALWDKKNPHYTNNWRRKRTVEVFEILGNKCVRCGIKDFPVLQVHHKDNSKESNVGYHFFSGALIVCVLWLF